MDEVQVGDHLDGKTAATQKYERHGLSLTRCVQSLTWTYAGMAFVDVLSQGSWAASQAAS